MAVILLDVEGTYTHLHERRTNADMLAALREQGLEPAGIPTAMMTVYHLVGRETANPDHPRAQPFSLQFAHLSPYAAGEISELASSKTGRRPADCFGRVRIPNKPRDRADG